jgi:integrase
MVRRYPKHVSEFRDRHGTIRIRYRRTGQAVYYFRAKAFSKDWWEEYEACIRGEVAPKVQSGRDRIIPGSVADLISRYYTSADWLGGMNDQSRWKARAIIDKMRENLGDAAVGAITYAECTAILGKMSDRPHALNRFRKLMRRVWEEGMRLGMVTINPWALTRGVKEDGPGFHSWTEEEIAQFQSHWPIGTRQRLALELMLLTAQRGGDARTLGPQHRKGDTFEMVQGKTRKPLVLQIVPELAAALAATPSGHLAYLVTEHGKTFSVRGFGQWFAKACDAAGLPHCRAHGLRKAAARRLAENGATAPQIKSWTGHKSDREVQRYIEAANQAKMNADSAHLLATQGEKVSQIPSKPRKKVQ